MLDRERWLVAAARRALTYLDDARTGHLSLHSSNEDLFIARELTQVLELYADDVPDLRDRVRHEQLVQRQRDAAEVERRR